MAKPPTSPSDLEGLAALTDALTSMEGDPLVLGLPP